MRSVEVKGENFACLVVVLYLEAQTKLRDRERKKNSLLGYKLNVLPLDILNKMNMSKTMYTKMVILMSMPYLWYVRNNWC